MNKTGGLNSLSILFPSVLVLGLIISQYAFVLWSRTCDHRAFYLIQKIALSPLFACCLFACVWVLQILHSPMHGVLFALFFSGIFICAIRVVGLVMSLDFGQYQRLSGTYSMAA